MEMDSGKLFIGGISWDTTEERLRDHFQTYGDVTEAVIMKDRITGRARGFGFIVFSNASVAEKVLKERHIIDGRVVEAKRAVPRDDHQNCNKNNGGSLQGSPSPARSRKIFVGGLASTVTESDFKRYFDQFGTITDVVVMYDHNTQRPRGFGFITFDSEEAVNKVLVKTFHELNGKMVEVKVAVPKELSPGPARNQPAPYNYALNRLSGLLNVHPPQGYNSTSAGSYGMRIDDRFSPVSVGRTGYSPHSQSTYSTGLKFNPGFGLNYGVVGDSGLGYARGMSSHYNGSPNRFYFKSDVDNIGSGSMLNASSRSLWGNETLSYGANSATSNVFGGFENGNGGMGGNFGTIGGIWNPSPMSDQQVNGNVSLSYRNIGHENWENYSGRTTYVGNNGSSASPVPPLTTSEILERRLENLYKGDSIFGDHVWRSSSLELEDPASFSYGLGGLGGTVTTPNNSAGYIGDYNVMNRSNRGIAT